MLRNQEESDTKEAAKFEVKDGELYYKQKGKVILVDLCVYLYLCVCKKYCHVRLYS